MSKYRSSTRLCLSSFLLLVLVWLQTKSSTDIWELQNNKNAISSHQVWAPRIVENNTAITSGVGHKKDTSSHEVLVAPIPSIHMVVAADNNFKKNYAPLFRRMNEYAVQHGYHWHVLGREDAECAGYKNFFFKSTALSVGG